MNEHNRFRALHGAAPLTWSQTLADAAASWASHCVFQHSGGTLGPYGENLAANAGEGTGTTAALAGIQLWEDEAPDYNPANPTYSHFTQMVRRALSFQEGRWLTCGRRRCGSRRPNSAAPSRCARLDLSLTRSTGIRSTWCASTRRMGTSQDSTRRTCNRRTTLDAELRLQKDGPVARSSTLRRRRPYGLSQHSQRRSCIPLDVTRLCRLTSTGRREKEERKKVERHRLPHNRSSASFASLPAVALLKRLCARP